MDGTDRARDGAPDPLPRAEAAALIRRLPAYGRLAWNISRDPDLPMVRRGALLGAAAYLFSPIDAIPGIIPVLGQLDDLLVVLLAIRFALVGLSPDRRRHHLEAAGLSEGVIGEDLAALGRLGAWTARAGGRTGRRVSGTALRSGRRVGGQLVGVGSGVAARIGSALPPTGGLSRALRRRSARR